MDRLPIAGVNALDPDRAFESMPSVPGGEWLAFPVCTADVGTRFVEGGSLSQPLPPPPVSPGKRWLCSCV